LDDENKDDAQDVDNDAVFRRSKTLASLTVIDVDEDGIARMPISSVILRDFIENESPCASEKISNEVSSLLFLLFVTKFSILGDKSLRPTNSNNEQQAASHTSQNDLEVRSHTYALVSRR